MTYRKKLIEVALPLEAINAESTREKSIRHGHPSTLHVWWARRPLAACRAVLFASLIDDPEQSDAPVEYLKQIDKLPIPPEARSDWNDLSEDEKRRKKLFGFIERLAKWEESNNEIILITARDLILASTNGNPPPILDPFCGGGSIPLEAQRLGLKVYGSDINPVAVLITKALTEIPVLFGWRPPVNREARKKMANASKWRDAAGLVEDVRYYGNWIRDEAEKRIGRLYPKAKLPKEKGGEANVIAWLWARTVECPNPACGAMMPLVRSFALSEKEGKKAWVEPIVNKRHKTVNFAVKAGKGVPPDGTINRRGARCIVCGEAVPFDHIRAEGKAGRIGAQLMAIAAEGAHGRLYLPPSEEHSVIASKAEPSWAPDTDLPEQALGFRVQLYGMTKHRSLFTLRQLAAMSTFSDLITEAHERIRQDAIASGVSDDGLRFEAGGREASAYADAVATYLAFVLDRMSTQFCTLSRWSSNPAHELVLNMFARQTMQMMWDFGEINPFSEAASWIKCLDFVCKVLDQFITTNAKLPMIRQIDAMSDVAYAGNAYCVSTDPPYYDNIGYADLSDYFYIWLRHTLGKFYPQMFSTLLVPKAQELVATPFRFGGSKSKAKEFFEEGLQRVFSWMQKVQAAGFPLTVFYAFKASETESDNEVNQVVSSTGWETMLEGLVKSGFAITGTWPMRTERAGRMLSQNTNALASSIVLVCRPRAESESLGTRREFTAALRRELPDALKKLQQGNVAPVDFAQAAIGPGMAIFSRYPKILEADGGAMRVRTALQLINQELDTYLAEQEGEFDGDTRFCVGWFEQKGMDEGAFGEADVLARAKNTSVEGLVRAGVLKARAGKVRLLKREEYDKDWNPVEDPRLTVWECTQYLIRALEEGGEDEAGKLASQLGGRAQDARALAYRLYAICERKGWAQEALAYNSLVAAWTDVQARTASSKYEQTRFV